MPNYYDIDDFLAEEELVPCTTFFDFSYLSHLDPDNTAPVSAKNKQDKQQQHLLPQQSKLQMPVWSIHKWADLGYVRLQLPKHYNRRARERLAADPAHVPLRDHFFGAGMALLKLCERSARLNAQQQQGGRSRNNAQLPRLEALLQDCAAVRQTLLQTYTGVRLKRTLDWALSSVGDDVSRYVQTLTALERRLYQTGAAASAGHAAWKRRAQARLLPHYAAVGATKKSSTAAAAATAKTRTANEKSNKGSMRRPRNNNNNNGRPYKRSRK